MDTNQTKVYASLVALRGNSDFGTVMSWVEAEREKLKEKLVQCDDARFQRLQGEVAAYGTILKMFREAPDVVERINTKG